MVTWSKNILQANNHPYTTRNRIWGQGHKERNSSSALAGTKLCEARKTQ